jgi:hypothetical protein
MTGKEKFKGFLMLVTAASLAYLLGDKMSSGRIIAQQATIIEQITAADVSMLRSRTNYLRPGITQDQVDTILQVADEYSMDPAFLYAGRRTENGGRSLYYGANMISDEIRHRYKDNPQAWQPAMFAKTWNKQLNKLAQKDLSIRSRVLTNLARQWNISPEKWALDMSLHLADAQGAKGLEVTEPPRKKPTPEPVSVKRGAPPKASRGGHKTPKSR